ncbi:MAG TPA: discoidin domain-containing protein [Streptosporangiaceae bacterium]|nr:discoidin domain-containing protein [Streptosporangiaceae bacterium]
MTKRFRLLGGLVASLSTVLATAQFVALAPAAHATETALSRTGWVASTSTSPGAADVPANAIDGNTSTRFSTDAAQASGMYFQVNMGSAQTFNQIVMDSGGSTGDYARGFNVEVSTNGSTFTSVATGTGTSSPETVTFSAQTAQYIRVVLTAGVTTNWWSIAEFNVFSGTAETVLTRTGWVASTSTSPGAADVPANAIDGNTSTRFSTDAAQASGMYFQVNMGCSQAFNQIVMDSGGSTGDYARGFNVEVSTNGSTFTSVATGTGTSSPETVSFADQTAQYIRVVLTTGVTTNWWSIAEFNAFSDTGSGGGCSGGGGPPTGGSLGPNVIIFTPSMSQSSIQSQLNTISSQQTGNQFGTQRDAIFFEPGTYGSTSTPLVFTVGYYTSVAGLGQNPSQVVINGAIQAFNQCSGTTCNATDNFWRSMSNLTINVAGNSGCEAGDDFWAVSQAAPMRRVQINGKLSLMDYCNGSPDFASGGFIADSRFSNTITNGSQQQFMTRNSSISSWSNSVWNQVFCGSPGAPAQSFASNSGDSGGPSSYTTLATCPRTEEEPYLYTDSSGNFNVFVPSPQTNSNGPTWTASSNTPGTSLSLNTFYVATPSSSVATINAALAAGDNLLFTPGVYSISSTINVTKADTKIIGLGFPTLVPTSGNITMNVADVNGVNISGLIFDAGTASSAALLQVGTQGSAVSHASDPVTIDDVFFRIGGATAGTAATAFIDNSNNSIIDDVWCWRADHGAGAGTFTGDVSNTGLIVNGNNVLAMGLFVEHFVKDEVIWNGQGGEDIFFQNENPYEVPSQSAWMSSSTQNGYPAFFIPNSVTSFTGYGMASYSFFNQGVAIENAMAFQAPNTSGVAFHDLLTVFLNGSGGIQSVINGTGAAVSSSFGGPSDVVSYP